jgi:2,4-dienoyl-CoA reductase-like NADH-dependent reductase (Old Yellow Enzyme family)
MLFDPIQIRGLTSRNRIVVSPMCQYSSDDGFANDWHLVHLGSRAVGGAGIVFAEATAVEPRGRISPQDLGVWRDEHIAGLKRVADFIRSQGSIPGIQLAHAGRKASTARPWDGGGPLDPTSDGWLVVGPSPIPFDDGYPVPEPLTSAGIADLTEAFTQAARRALDAGFQVVEVHAAHGYLLHEFLSPVSNTRTDGYGGAFEKRARIVREIVRSIRTVWPEALPLFLRISATDWLDDTAWNIEQSVALCRILQGEGVDLIDCSSGGLVPYAKVPTGPGFQVPFAGRIRKDVGILTGAMGLITSGAQAEMILKNGQADMILLARQFLRDPYWPLHAAVELGGNATWPVQYLSAKA